MTVFAPDDYVGFCEGLREICGIDLTQYKRPQMERRLRTFFERRGVNRLTDCLESLRADRQELEALLDRMTINVSQLWRNPEQWKMLAEHACCPSSAPSGQIRAWSAGSSYGAEAYTLAAVCQPSPIPGAQVRILGTDIDRRMVERARGRPVHRRGRAQRPGRRAAALVRARSTDGWQATAAAPGDDAVRGRRPAAAPAATRELRPDPVPQHGHLLRRAGARRAARAARRARCAPAAISSSARPSGSSKPAAHGPRRHASLHLQEDVMDTSEYMPMFLAEAREHLQELNLAVVRLEESPDDRATVDEIFRIAHSLKGMSATMGFARIAELTHEMEDVFELLRQRTGGLGEDAVDSVLACLDALSGAVDSIENDGRGAARPGAADRATAPPDQDAHARAAARPRRRRRPPRGTGIEGRDRRRLPRLAPDRDAGRAGADARRAGPHAVRGAHRARRTARQRPVAGWDRAVQRPPRRGLDRQ